MGLPDIAPTKKPWESKETIVGVLALLLPFILLAVKEATGMEVDITAEQLYQGICLFWGMAIIGMVSVRQLWTRAKIKW